MYRCLALKWHLSSGISYPAELIVLSSSKSPWEEIFASWRRVGFLGGRISPCGTWHLIGHMQMFTHIWICKTRPASKAVRVAQFSIWRDTKRWSNFLARCQQRQWSEQDWWKYLPDECIGLNRPLQPYPNPRCILKYSEKFHFFFFFLIYFYLQIGCFLVPSCKEAADLRLRFPEEKF